MNLIQKFSFTETQDVMTLAHPAHGILFDATNVCSILELRDTTSALRRLDDDEKVLLKREEYERFPDSASEAESEFDRQKGAKSKWFVTEPGLYTLTLGSEKPQAKVFKRWITHEVIPALRKTGTYNVLSTETVSPLERSAINLNLSKTELAKRELANCVALVKEFTNITGNQLLLSANRLFKKLYEVDVLKEIDVDLKSKVQARCLCVTDLGKKIGLSAVATNSLLEEANLQTCSYHKGHKVWTATEEGKKYSEYLDTGKKHGNGEPIQSLKWYETVLEHTSIKQNIIAENNE